MGKKYITTKDNTAFFDEFDNIDFKANGSKLDEIFIKKNKLEFLNKEKRNILYNNEKFKNKIFVIANILVILTALGFAPTIILTVIMVAESFLPNNLLMLYMFSSLVLETIFIKKIHCLNQKFEINNKLLNYIEEVKKRTESELKDLKKQKLDNENFKEYNVERNLDSKERLIELKQKLELYSEYFLKSKRYDRLEKKGKLGYKLQKKHTNKEIEIIEGLAHISNKEKQKVKRFGE